MCDNAACEPYAAICLGIGDVADCFHRMLIPLWLSRLYCLKPVLVERVGMVGKLVEGSAVQKGEWIYPCPASLPMGCA